MYNLVVSLRLNFLSIVGAVVMLLPVFQVRLENAPTIW